MNHGDLGRLLAKAVAAGGPATSDFELNPGLRPPGRTLPLAGVLVAVEPCADGPRLYLTKRASSLKHHPGQIAFPGGKVDPGDDGSVIRAALREAREEIGLPSENVQVVGVLPHHQTVSHFAMTPVLAIVTEPFRPVAEAGEVDEVFTVPLAHVLDPTKYQTHGRFWEGVERRYFTVPYGPYYIWGATARVLRVLADRLAT